MFRFLPIQLIAVVVFFDINYALATQAGFDSIKPEKPIVLTVGTEILPSWFFDMPSEGSDVVYSVGISDPGVDDSIASLQAIHRAVFVAGMMQGVDVSGIFDNYESDNGKKIEEMNKIRKLNPVIGQYFIVDSFKTRFKEKVYLLKLACNAKDTIKINGSVDYYKSEVVSDIGTKDYISITCKYRIDTCKYLYLYEQNGNDFAITSVANKHLNEIPFGMFQYNKKGNNDSTTICLQHKGLWYGYFQTLMEEMTIQTSLIQSKIKSLGQVENQNSQKQLARDIINKKLAFRISKVIPVKGKLEISLSVIK
jgi:hypothetical protein